VIWIERRKDPETVTLHIEGTVTIEEARSGVLSDERAKAKIAIARTFKLEPRRFSLKNLFCHVR
jgi:hypothetical protein